MANGAPLFVGGSSPRVWGIRPSQAAICSGTRFIPTRVGNTWFRELQMRQPPVHPHACGEYLSPPARKQTPTGSSPRVWGIRASRYFLPYRWRFIPTRVGNTSPRPVSSVSVPVHPHACGEYFQLIQVEVKKDGSSPRVWGIQPWVIAWFWFWRFIPTRVGNTNPTPAD